VTIKDALKSYSADAIRIFVLGSHYRSPLTYSEEALAAAEKGAERLLRAVSRDDGASGGEKLDAAPYRTRFTDAMDDDFNTPEAMAALFDLARAINQTADSGGDVKDAQAELRRLGEDLMGLKLEAAASFQPGEAEQALVQSLIDDRAALRKAKQFALADRIRGSLDEIGIILEDSNDGTKAIWKNRETLKPGDIAALEGLHVEAASVLG
jgi:cysteinyl-tRNA synthetase